MTQHVIEVTERGTKKKKKQACKPSASKLAASTTGADSAGSNQQPTEVKVPGRTKYVQVTAIMYVGRLQCHRILASTTGQLKSFEGYELTLGNMAMTASPPIPPLWTDWPRLISQGREDAARRMRHSGEQTCMCVGGALWHRALQKPVSTLGKILQHHKLTALIPHAYVTMDQAVKYDESYQDLAYWLPSVAVGCGPCSSRHDLSKGIQREHKVLEGGAWLVVKTARQVRVPPPAALDISVADSSRPSGHWTRRDMYNRYM